MSEKICIEIFRFFYFNDDGKLELSNIQKNIPSAKKIYFCYLHKMHLIKLERKRWKWFVCFDILKGHGMACLSYRNST